MKKKTPKHTKPNIAWGDDEPVVENKKLPPPKKMSPAEHKAAAKRNSAAIQGTDVDDLIGEKPKADKVVPIKNVGLDRGVYMGRNSATAIVISTTGGKVQFTFLGPSGIEYAEWHTAKFIDTYHIALPHYPIRRAARLYMDSPQPKDDKSDRLLRGLLRA